MRDQNKQDLIQALKEKRSEEVLVLRTISAELLNMEKEKHYQVSKKNPDLSEQDLVKQSALVQEDIVKVIFSEAKKRKEAIVEFEKANRQDLVDKEKAELEIINKYLPELASEDEIKQRAEQVIQELGASGPQDMGKVISKLMAEFSGKVEGSTVSGIVKNLLIK